MKTKFATVCVVAVMLALILHETDGFSSQTKNGLQKKGYKRSKVKLKFNIAKKPKAQKDINR